MASAFETIHGIGVAHRDIKPKNILLKKRDPHPDRDIPGEWSSFPYKAVICDFGICYIDSVEAVTTIEATNLFGISYKFLSFLSSKHFFFPSDPYKSIDTLPLRSLESSLIQNISPIFWNSS